MKKILFMLLLCTPLLYMGCKAEPEWVNLIAQQEQEKGQEEKREEADSEFKWANLADSCTTVLDKPVHEQTERHFLGITCK